MRAIRDPTARYLRHRDLCGSIYGWSIDDRFVVFDGRLDDSPVCFSHGLIVEGMGSLVLQKRSKCCFCISLPNVAVHIDFDLCPCDTLSKRMSTLPVWCTIPRSRIAYLIVATSKPSLIVVWYFSIAGSQNRAKIK